MTAVEAKAVADRPKNNVRVGLQKSNALYADVSKHLLAGGESEVVISGLGSAVPEAVTVVEMLKNQGVVVVKSIRTSRGQDENARRSADKIEIVVVKAKDFDAKYAEQQKVRDARKAAKEAEQK